MRSGDTAAGYRPARWALRDAGLRYNKAIDLIFRDATVAGLRTFREHNPFWRNWIFLNLTIAPLGGVSLSWSELNGN
jgi:hypothetical protein